jgi:hypothetical protein
MFWQITAIMGLSYAFFFKTDIKNYWIDGLIV